MPGAMARSSAAPDSKSAPAGAPDEAEVAAKSGPKSKRGRRDGAADGRAGSSTFSVAFRRSLRDVARTVARVVDQGVRAFHVIMKIIGPCFICLALGLIGFCTYTYFVHLLPTLEGRVGKLGEVCVTILGMFLVSNTLYNYAKSIMTDPGLPPEYDEALLTMSEESQSAPPKQCKHCGRLKPQRCHHCSVCGRCVLKMDHHCPWINNCVGFGNYRHFVLFLLFLSMSCLFVIVVYFPSFYEVAFTRRRRGIGLSRSARQSIMTSFMIACSILVALSILGGFHFYLVLTNQTTIEFQLNMINRREAKRNGEYFRNPYDMGRRRNFHAVFGPSAFCSFKWLMPYIAQPPTGDGLTFTSISGLKL